MSLIKKVWKALIRSDVEEKPVEHIAVERGSNEEPHLTPRELAAKRRIEKGLID